MLDTKITMPNTHEHTPGVEALIADFHQKQLRYKRRLRHACAACGEPGDHGIDSNYTHQFDDGMDTYGFPDSWLYENFTTHHQKSIEAVVARLEGEKKAMRGEINIDDHYKLGYSAALSDAITLIRDTLKS